MTRTEARELFMQLLFQMEAQNDYGVHIKEKFFSENVKGNSQRKYLEEIFELCIKNLSEADKLIEASSEKWKIERMCKVDLAVMRTAVTEIMHMEKIPDSVAINEAVEIAKKYGTEDSGKFVNGILGKVVRIKNGN